MIKEKLKIVIVTMDEPYYVPKYINDTLAKLSGEIEVLKVYALPPNVANKKFTQTVWDHFLYFGPIVFSYMVLLRALYLLSDLVNRHFNINDNLHSINLVCNKFGVTFANADKINSEHILNELKTLKPDIIFSISCPQIMRNEIISIPAIACLNIHSSLLPKYRGLNANFWAMAKGESTSGVTIHYIKPGIDDGDILLQEAIEIDNKWSLHELYLKAIDVGSDMIVKCLNQIREDKVTTRKNDISKGSYYSCATRKDVKEFRSRNKKFFRFC